MSDTEKTIAGDMSDFALDLLDGIILMTYIFDTGATHVLSSANVHNMLKKPGPSALAVQGYHGDDRQHGLMIGQLSGYVPGSSLDVPMALEFTTDTMQGSNAPLFSFTELYEQQGFSLSLAQPGQWSGLYKIDPTSGTWTHKIPLRYDRPNHQWILEMVIVQPNRVRQRG
jgi:hypothetical protein